MPSPNEMKPGVVVRVRCAGGGIALTSRRMEKGAADVFAGQFESKVARAREGEFVTFSANQGDVKVRADKVTTIEVVRVDALAPRYFGGVEHPVPRTNGLERR